MSDERPKSATEEPRDRHVRAVELLISRLLRVGVAVSLSVVAIGATVSFLHHPEYLSQPPALGRLTAPGAAFPHTVRDVADGAADGRGQAIVTIGLLLLIATPVLRVAVSIVGFAKERDWRYVLITGTVLALLLLSLVLGKAES